jgi:hypothetical protein
MPAIEMVPKHTLSFKEFVRLSEHQRKNLGQVTMIPPALGKPGFGCVVAERPVFVKPPFKGPNSSKGRLLG